MKKRLLAWLLTGVMAVSVLAGCGNSGNEGAASEVTEESSEAASAEEESGEATAEPEAAPATDGEKTVITFWNGFTGSDKETLEALVQEYNETNDKNIQVEMNIMPWDSLYQKLATVLPVGEGPDILAMATERIGTYAEPGAFVPVDDIYSQGIVDRSEEHTSELQSQR